MEYFLFFLVVLFSLAVIAYFYFEPDDSKTFFIDESLLVDPPPVPSVDRSIKTGVYLPVDSLLSLAEYSFYKVLLDSVEPSVTVFSKVRIADVVHVKPGLSRPDFKSYFLRISQKHFDFVLCDSSSMSIIAVVELDDKSHNTKKGKARDSLVNDVCSSAGLKIHRFKVSSSYSVLDVKSTLYPVSNTSVS